MNPNQQEAKASSTTTILKFLRFLFDFIVTDSFRGFFKLYSYTKMNWSNDDELKEMSDKFSSEYLKDGWEITITVQRTITFITILVGYFILEDDHPFKYRATVAWPILFSSFIFMDTAFQMNKSVRDIWLILSLLILGAFIIHGSLIRPTYTFYEFWIIYFSICQSFWIFLFMKWMKIILAFWGVVVVYLWLMEYRFGSTPFALYLALIWLWMLFPATSMFVTHKIKEMILLIKTNNDLTHTIRSILQAFPEGVIIRSIDK